MPLTTTDYCTAVELKAYLRIQDTVDDAELGFAITAASRAIDHAMGRPFGVDSSPVARYFTYQPVARAALAVDELGGRQALDVVDISSTVGLVVKVDADDDGTFETTLTLNTDYRLWPWNAAADGRPWERIVLSAAQAFPHVVRGVEVTAAFGWASVPVVVKQATLLQASRFFKRRDAPFGVAGSPEMGSEMRLLARLDPDVAVLTGLHPYRRIWGVA